MHAIILAIISINIFSTVAQDAAFEAKVDSVINKALECRKNKNPGLSVAVVKGGKVLLAKGYGFSDVSTGRRASNTTNFAVASNSKAFAATLMLKQLHDRNMSIYTHVADIIKGDFHFKNSYYTSHIAIRDLLCHASGLPSYNLMRLDPTLTKAEMARRVRYLDTVHPFRTTFMYSNLNYGLVAYCSEILGGKSYEDLIRENIFTPLGMSQSSFLKFIGQDHNDVALGYADDEENGGIVPVPYELDRVWGENGGSTGIVSNAVDMTKWLMFHLSGGKNQHGQTVVEKDTLSSMYKSQMGVQSSSIEGAIHRPKTPVTLTEVSYDLGIKNGFYRGYRILRHTGTTYGFSSLLTLFPEMNVGIFTAMSGEDENYVFRGLLHSYLADIAIGEDQPWLNETTICTFPEPWYHATPSSHHRINRNHHSTHALSTYEGTYHNIAFGDLKVALNSTIGQLQMTYGKGLWTLYPLIHQDSFYGEGQGFINKLIDVSPVNFKVAGSGSTVHTTSVEIPDFESSAPPVFQKQTSSGGSAIIG
ncbi:hypothetical protein ACJMK2_043577 [Sinanodonta woodiana]|uniref:Beta-lactamase-related domain-containing protein n=1 Tax=Sinanodonta woodiana TaxID=1069815 RepID=A0ABD3W0J0_SINWO